MGTVIGYIGTASDRLTNWRLMLLLKEHIGYFRLKPNKNSDKIIENDKRLLSKTYKEYIGTVRNNEQKAA